jgi:hypothetical protein
MGNNLACACDKPSSDQTSEVDFSSNNFDTGRQVKEQKARSSAKPLRGVIDDKIFNEAMVNIDSFLFEVITEEMFEKKFPSKAKDVFNQLSHSELIVEENEKDLVNVQLPPMMCKKEKEYYWGEWNLLGEKNGLGKLIKEDGSVYIGLFHHNKFEGKGVLIRESGDYFLGNWKSGVAHGNGQIILTSQRINFSGGFQNNLREGYGEESYPDGSVYKGNYKNNEKDGEGCYLWPDRTVFTGMFKHSMLHGYGEMTWTDGRVYKGNFSENKLHGKGIHKWPDGSSYDGFYSQGKKSGEGVFQWTKDKFYTGSWLNNKQHGNGQVSVNGKSFMGLWRFGKVIKLSEITENKAVVDRFLSFMKF